MAPVRLLRLVLALQCVVGATFKATKGSILSAGVSEHTSRSGWTSGVDLREIPDDAANDTSTKRLPSSLVVSRSSSSKVGGLSQDEYHDEDHELPWYSDIMFPLAEIFGFLGVVVIVVGTLIAATNLAIFTIANSVLDWKEENTEMWPGILLGKGEFLTFNGVREQFAKAIVAALDILVVADIVETLAEPLHLITWDTLGKMGIVVAIRTSLALHLSHEMHDIVADKEEEEEILQEKIVQSRLASTFSVGLDGKLGDRG